MTSLAVAEDLQGQPHLSLLVYPTVTSLVQTKEINEYIRGLWKKDRTSFWMAISEYVVFFGTMIVLFLFDWRRALLFVQVALFLIQCVNFLQHVRTDAPREWNDSRNFASPTPAPTGSRSSASPSTSPTPSWRRLSRLSTTSRMSARS